MTDDKKPIKELNDTDLEAVQGGLAGSAAPNSGILAKRRGKNVASSAGTNPDGVQSTAGGSPDGV